MLHVCNPNTWEAERGTTSVLGQLSDIDLKNDLGNSMMNGVKNFKTSKDIEINFYQN